MLRARQRGRGRALVCARGEGTRLLCARRTGNALVVRSSERVEGDYCAEGGNAFLLAEEGTCLVVRSRKEGRRSIARSQPLRSWPADEERAPSPAVAGEGWGEGNRKTPPRSISLPPQEFRALPSPPGRTQLPRKAFRRCRSHAPSCVRGVAPSCRTDAAWLPDDTTRRAMQVPAL